MQEETIKFFKRILCTATKHPFGGGIAIVPTADASKPVIDLSWSNESISLKSCGSFFTYTEKQLKSKYFHHYTTNRLRIVSTTPQHGQEDGEEMENDL